MDFNVMGVPVSFPYKPYACQLSLMYRVVDCLESSRNSLLESPTGTGKTLSLLCSSLGWLNNKIERMNAEYYADSSCMNENGENIAVHSNSSPNDNDETGKSLNESDAVYKVDEEEQLVYPKIYYCTRTHKQITQVIGELRKTKYRKAKMTVLGSRQHTCINPTVNNAPNVTEACRNLIMAGTCPYDQPRKASDLTKAVKHLDKNGPWDLEDLVKVLSPVPSCPYFCSRKLAKSADIIFCPYNYLLDPINRSATAIDLTGNIVILDEAHNIEDASRESASFQITDKQLSTTKEELEGLLKSGFEVESCTLLLTMIDAVIRVMQLTRSRLVRAGETAEPTQVWTGQEIFGLLSTVGLSPDQINMMEQAHTKLAGSLADDALENSRKPDQSDKSLKMGSSSGSSYFFQALFVMLGYMYRNNQAHLADYRVVLMETLNYERQGSRPVAFDDYRNSPRTNWFNARSAKSRYVEIRELTLNFWCLNPSVVFLELASQARCVILTSGTLSPLDSLEAELAVPFPIRLEAGHVVNKDRLFVTSVAMGPNNVRLCSTYEHQNKYEFQDELGRLVLQSCNLVPGGVLCFLPSYGLLDKLLSRWEVTGLINLLRSVKHVMIEPRSSVGLDSWLDEFYAAIDASSTSPTFSRRPKKHPVQDESEKRKLSGALAFAVYRGKVSEGLDFSDSYGRLVIAVGIPYPAFNNPQVQQKRQFNDNLTRPIQSNLISPMGNRSVKLESLPVDATETKCNQQQKRFLTGTEWYDAQAYRALNQALGRCIRHANDWGAILLADARFSEQPSRYMSGISKWIRTRITHHTHWSSASVGLDDFVKARQSDEKLERDCNELDDIFAV